MTSVKQWIGGALVIAASVWVGTAIPQSGSPAPVRFDREKIGGLNLTAIPPDAYREILVAGELNMRVASLFDDLKKAKDIEGELVQRVRDRIFIPGFGHQLYPDGDIRAATLFALLRETVPDSPELAFAERLAIAGERLIDRKPNVDFTTVVVERVLGLPKDSALALFRLGRTVGWIAHALEQSAHAALIRPRARYTGPRPGG